MAEVFFMNKLYFVPTKLHLPNVR